MNATFARQMTVEASTKRPPAIVSGKRGAPEAYLPSLLCSPLYPVDSDMQMRDRLESPHELRQTFVAGDYDVREGDVMTIAGVDYPVRSVADWPWPRGDVFLQVVVEELKEP